MYQGFTLEELAKVTGSEIIGDSNHRIHSVSDLETATKQDASFLSNGYYSHALKTTEAGAIFVTKDNALLQGKNFLIHSDPSRAFQMVIELILRDKEKKTGFLGIHSTSVIHPSARIGKGVNIGPYAVIDQDVVIGDEVTIGPHTYIGLGTLIGHHSLLYSHVTIREYCHIGSYVIIHSGARIGSCGFGLLTNKQGKHEKLKQLGNVLIEDDVEIGANTTIDRARFASTKIGRGTKIDNLVMIAHGVEVGEDNVLVAQSGISGSSKTGNRVILAGQTGIAGHLTLGNDVVVAAKSGVSKSIKKAGFYGGIPALPIQEYNKQAVHFRNLQTYVERIKELEERLSALEQTETHD